MQLTRTLRILLFTAVSTVATWMALLLLTALAGDAYNAAKATFPRTDDRVALPNYPDKERARRMFADFKETVEDYVPFLAWRRLPMETVHVNIGPQGYRVHRLGRENNTPEAISIGFFGGSTMWGTGVADDNTIPAIFDQLTTRYEVSNYGEGGHTTRQMLALLINLIDTRKLPDVVVFYDGFNHIWTHCNYAVTRLLNGHMVERKLRRALTERPQGGFVYADVVAPPVAFVRRLIGEKRFIRNEFVCHDDPVRAEQVAEALVRIWEMADTLVSHYGGRFFAFLQPVAYVGHPKLDHLELPRVVGGEQFRSVYPLIRSKAQERGFEWFSEITDAFDRDEYIYIDDSHVTPNGNEIVARRMLERIGRGPQGRASSAARLRRRDLADLP